MPRSETAKFFVPIYRSIFKRDFDQYDTIASSTTASLAGKCNFCDIVVNHSNIDIWYEDEHLLVFPDRKPRAKIHGLCIPKRHIRDINALRKEDIELLDHM